MIPRHRYTDYKRTLPVTLQFVMKYPALVFTALTVINLIIAQITSNPKQTPLYELFIAWTLLEVFAMCIFWIVFSLVLRLKYELKQLFR